MIFKMLFLAGFYRLSDGPMGFEARNQPNFMHFLGVGIIEAVLDAKTLRVYRPALVDAGRWEAIQQAFNDHLHAFGYQAWKGQMLDSSFARVPK